MTYTAESPHADGRATSGTRPRFRPPRRREPHATSPAPTTTGCLEDRCPVVSKRPLHSRAAANMSQYIFIGPEPVLTNHAQSPPAAGSHSQAREDSAPHCGTEFHIMLSVHQEIVYRYLRSWMYGEYSKLLVMMGHYNEAMHVHNIQGRPVYANLSLLDAEAM